MPSIAVRNLSKCYTRHKHPAGRLLQILFRNQRQTGETFCALNGVDFELAAGEALGIVGKNGAGKSTLLQLISGTLQPTSGEVQVNGRVAALLELGAGFHPEFTGRENIYMNAAILGMAEEEIQAHFQSIVDFSGIGDFIDQPVKTYSSGMHVRLAFSIATTVEPDILVIDEALSVGDGEFARKSFDRIMALRESGTTLLFCSHAMYHIEALCDRALWLDGGKMRMLDASHRVTQAYQEKLLQHPASASEETTSGSKNGLAQIRHVGVSVDGQTGRRFSIRPGSAHVRVNVDFFADPSLPSPAMAFGLESVGGIPVSSGSTFHDGVSVSRDSAGRGSVMLELFDLPLMRGDYRLTIFLACERALHVYDHATHCAEFEVIDESSEQGIVFLSRAWNEGETLVTPARNPG